MAILIKKCGGKVKAKAKAKIKEAGGKTYNPNQSFIAGSQKDPKLMKK